MTADAEPAEDLLSVGDVARRLGVAAATVRTWERRYGLAPSGRSAGGHRRYTPAEVAVLDRMHEFVLRGDAPARAALLARATGPGDALGQAVGQAFGERTGPGGPGGRVLAVRGAGPAVAGLARAAVCLDIDAVEGQVLRSLQSEGATATWDDLLRPVLVAAGEHWATSGEGIDVEHLLTEATLGALRQYRHETTNRTPAQGRPVLLASAPRDQHTLALHVLGALLAEQGIRGRVMGPQVPVEALAAAAARIGAAAVFVWSQIDSAGTDLAALPVTRPPLAVVVGGPGWVGRALPARARLVDSAGAAAELLARAAART